MEETIYILCEKRETVDGRYQYCPVVIQGNEDPWVLVACNDLVALQEDHRDLISDNTCDGLEMFIIPTDFSTYCVIQNEFSKNMIEVKNRVKDAVDALRRAYEVLGREADTETIASIEKNMFDHPITTKCFDERKCLSDMTEYKQKESPLPFSTLTESTQYGTGATAESGDEDCEF